MSANSLNRYTPVPPISPTQPVDEKKMSSKKETKQTQSSDLNISGGAAIFSKPPVIKRQSSVTAKTAGADSKEKKVPDADAKANCTQVEMQSNGEAEKEVTSAATTDAVEHELVQSQERSVEMKNEDASLTVKENADSTAAVNGSNDDDDNDDDDQSHQVSVSFVLHV